MCHHTQPHLFKTITFRSIVKFNNGKIDSVIHISHSGALLSTYLQDTRDKTGRRLQTYDFPYLEVQ